MDDSRPEIVYPTAEQIIEINRRMVAESGGSFFPPDNLHNRSSLLYILDAIAYPVAGRDMHPSLEEKAAALFERIITSHVFFDGNKRTAVHTAWEFLQSNGINIYLDISVIDLAVDVAQGLAGQKEILDWLQERREE